MHYRVTVDFEVYAETADEAAAIVRHSITKVSSTQIVNVQKA